MGSVSDDLSHVELMKAALSVFKGVNELSSHAHEAGWIRHIFKLHSTSCKLIRTILRSICGSITLSFGVMEKYLASQSLEWFLRYYHLSDFCQYMKADIINPNHYWSWNQFHVSAVFDLVRHWYTCKNS